MCRKSGRKERSWDATQVGSVPDVSRTCDAALPVAGTQGTEVFSILWGKEKREEGERIGNCASRASHLSRIS
jgi:hypothetical protein